MRNKFLTALFCLLTVFAFSNLANSQDPEGALDFLTVDCGTNIYPGAGTVAVSFDLKLTTDNTGGNRLAAFGVPLIITGANIVSVDTTVAAALAGSVASAFSILSVGKNGVADPTVPPFHMVYGAVNFAGGVPAGANLQLFTITVNVNDTGTICIDSLSTALNSWSAAFVTELAVGFAPGWGGPYCCPVAPYVNQNPVVNCGGEREAFAGGTFDHAVLATDPDDPNDICDDIVSAEFQFLDGALAPIGGPNTAPCGVATLGAFAPGPAVSAQFNWNTTGCGEACYYVVFTFTDECGGSGADTCHYCIKTACAFVTIGEVIADPCATVELPVYLNAAGDDIGGFNFCIEFSNADLTAISVRRGDLIDDVDPQYNNKYKWHYFTYRLNPSTVIHKYKVCVVGIGQTYSAYPGICIPQGATGVLFYIKFVLACNELFRCHDTHVFFEWDDWTCLENTLSDCTGNKLYVSDDTLNYPLSCGLGEKNEIVRCVNFQNGRVIWRCPHDVDPIVIGDINVNGFPYEIADAVLFARYFIEGEGVFMGGDTGVAQIGATDINRDGYVLSVADLVYLLRIIVGDQAPLGEGTALGDAKAVATLDGHRVYMQTTEALGAVVFTFKGEGTVASMNKDLTVLSNSGKGETKVIVYSMAKGIAIEDGENLFSINGNVTLVKAEAATYGAQPITVEVSGRILPTSFSLSQNYPNPFNATTQISFALPVDGKVSLKVYNVAGQLVKSFDQQMTAGYKIITWDGKNNRGDEVASGVYFYRLDVEKQFSKTMKMTLLK
jgi:hypothetical protein